MYYTYDDKECPTIWGALMCKTKRNERSYTVKNRKTVDAQLDGKGPKFNVTTLIAGCQNLTSTINVDYTGNNTFSITAPNLSGDVYYEGEFSYSSMSTPKKLTGNQKVYREYLSKCR